MKFKETQMILFSLTYSIYLSLKSLLIVIFSVTKILFRVDVGDHEDNHQDGHSDFSGLKLKLISSIVAISGIHLLKLFLDITKYTREEIYLFIAVHLIL